MIKIVVDTLGGDRGPNAVLDGVKQAMEQNTDVSVVLTGDAEFLQNKVSELGLDSARVEIVHAPDEISCNESPTDAIKHKTESSMYKAFEILHTREDVSALVSMGSSGALLAGAVLRIGRIRGVKRPAFCPIVPTFSAGPVAICDSGANVDCDSLQLQQFGIMASMYMKTAYGVENPRVALLNVGVEEAKGDMLRKETHQLLKETKQINFVGNMEARDLLSGEFDVVVCDGFSGNVLLKSTEGVAIEMLKTLKTTMTKNFKNKMGALLLKKDVYSMKDKMDYNNCGGAVILGTTKTIVKAHGSSKSTAIFHCIEQAYNMEKNGIRDAISQGITASLQQ